MVPEGCACGVDPKQLMCIGLNSWPRKPKEKKKKKTIEVVPISFHHGHICRRCMPWRNRTCVFWGVVYDALRYNWCMMGYRRHRAKAIRWVGRMPGNLEFSDLMVLRSVHCFVPCRSASGSPSSCLLFPLQTYALENVSSARVLPLKIKIRHLRSCRGWCRYTEFSSRIGRCVELRVEIGAVDARMTWHLINLSN